MVIAINLQRFVDWVWQTPRSQTRLSHFARLEMVAGFANSIYPEHTPIGESSSVRKSCPLAFPIRRNMRAKLLFLALVALGIGWAQKEVVDTEAVTAGLKTALMLERPPCAYRITWVEWDSPLRSQAQIGDLVTVINGEAVPCVGYISDTKKDKAAMDKLRELTQRGLGGLSEAATWKEKGLKEGSPLVLTVLRKAKESGMDKLELKGSLRAQRNYFAADGKPTFGLNGPASIEQDGLNQAWGSWYEDFARTVERVLDGGLQRRINTRQLLPEVMQDQPRLELLEKKYPGPFARAVREDWERVQAILIGNEYKISDKDLEYRQSGDKIAARVAEESQKARAAALEQWKKDTIEAFPAVDPIKGDRDTVKGKVVVLGPIQPSDWTMEAGHCYLTSGDSRRGYYFIDCENPATRRMFEARYRYQRMVSPQIPETYSVIGRITGAPKMLVIRGQAMTGLDLEPIAASVGDKVFMDLTVNQNNVSPFAGEATLSAPANMPPGKATPREVMETLIKALKLGDESTWRALFASWTAERFGGGQVQYRPNYTGSMSEDWIRSRRLILDSVYDVKVAYVSEVDTVLTGKEYTDAPVIEEVMVELEHVGRFDNVYRSFLDINVHRVWKLQRVNNGPWRIVSVQGI
jgi:hypothetical protein